MIETYRGHSIRRAEGEEGGFPKKQTKTNRGRGGGGSQICLYVGSLKNIA